MHVNHMNYLHGKKKQLIFINVMYMTDFQLTSAPLLHTFTIQNKSLTLYLANNICDHVYLTQLLLTQYFFFL